MPQKTT